MTYVAEIRETLYANIKPPSLLKFRKFNSGGFSMYKRNWIFIRANCGST